MPVSCEITVLQAVSQISISAENILWTGSTQKIVPVISPEDASVQNVLWESSDPSVATVDVRGLTVGAATIKCISTDGSGVFGECAVRVEAKTQSIDFIEKTVSLLIGAGEDHSTMVLTLSTTPADAYYQTATWTSSDENVVTVDAQGRLRAVSEVPMPSACRWMPSASKPPPRSTSASPARDWALPPTPWRCLRKPYKYLLNFDPERGTRKPCCLTRRSMQF